MREDVAQTSPHQVGEEVNKGWLQVSLAPPNNTFIKSPLSNTFIKHLFPVSDGPLLWLAQRLVKL
jgi:hypothetical protein